MSERAYAPRCQLRRYGSVVRVQPDLNVGAGLVFDGLRPAEGAAEDRGRFQPLLQDDGSFAARHELAAVDHQPPGGGANAGVSLARMIPQNPASPEAPIPAAFGRSVTQRLRPNSQVQSQRP